jgi:hypothetical protein
MTAPPAPAAARATVAPRPPQVAHPAPRITASAPAPRPAAAPRPIQAAAQPAYAPRPQHAAQQPYAGQQVGAPMQISNVPRPPGAIGAGGPQAAPRPQRTADNGNAVGTFFGNLFGQR